jgi:heme/copper-type cytochrome/quinol oxidase subunit 2
MGLGKWLRHFSRHPKLLRTVALLTTPQIASGCQNSLSMMHPAGPAAQTIADMWWIMLVGGGAVFVLVMGALGLALLHLGDQTEDEEGGTRLWLWGFGLALPMVTLAVLTAYGLVMGEKLMPRDTTDLTTVQAEARQWEWTFRYGGTSLPATGGVLHIPAGRPVNVEITSVDVIHSFWVPQLAGKLDAIPGHINVLRIEAADPGTYLGQSAEFSGRGYREHVFTVQAHDAVSWAKFLNGDTK